MQKGSVRPDLSSGPTSCLVQTQSRYRIFNKIVLETVWQEKKNLCEMKKKKKEMEEGSLFLLWRCTVYKVKQIVQKGSGRPDLRFGLASCLVQKPDLKTKFGLKLCRRRKFWKMKKWKKEAYFRWGGAHWTRLKKFVQEGSGQLDLRFSKYQSRRVPIQPVASSSLDQKNGSLKWMCHKRKLWKIFMKWKKEGQD